MGNDGNKENLEQKPLIDPNIPIEVLRVDLVGGANGKLQPKINSNYIPMLCFAITLLEIEVQKMIINTQITNARQGIIVPKKHGIIDFLRGRR